MHFECFATKGGQKARMMGVMRIINIVKNRYSAAKTKSQSLKKRASVMGENEPFSDSVPKAETKDEKESKELLKLEENTQLEPKKSNRNQSRPKKQAPKN